MKKLLFVLSSFICLNAYAADPTYDATKGALQNDSSLCSYGYNSNCNQSRSIPIRKIINHTTVNIPSKYGALAHSKTGAIAGSINAASQKEAEREAIKRCESGENIKCKVILSVRNGCFAAAIGKIGSGDNGKIFKAISKTPQTTERIALKKCQSSQAFECKIIVPEACSIP